MDHIIKRNGRHSSDVLLSAMGDGDPVYPSRLKHPRDLDYRYAGSVRMLCTTAEKCILMLTLDADTPENQQELQAIARTALVDRVVAGVTLADHVSVWVFAEEADYPVLFSDPAVTAVASMLERGIQDKNRQLGDPVAYVPSRGREITSAI